MYVSQKVTGKFKLLILPVLALFLMSGTLMAQNIRVTGKVIDKTGQPLMGVSVLIEGTRTGVATELDGTFSMEVPANAVLQFSAIGMENLKETVNNRKVINVTMSESTVFLDELVVTALGIKKEKKALGYAVQDIKGAEILKNKSSNVINSLSGKIAGVNITQSSGAAGVGASILIRGGTSLERDNQPLFVVDGIIYDNSTPIGGNSGFDGAIRTATTNSNRIMDINPEDVENMSILKGPAAAALYGSKAAAGVVIITTKKGQEGNVRVDFSTKFASSWVNRLPEQQDQYGRGYYEQTGLFNDYSTGSWGKKITSTDQVYNNIKDFFQTGTVVDNSLSVSGGNKNGTFYLSASRFDQKGIVPTTGYDKTTVRFNGDQKYGKFAIGANVSYSIANTDKTLTSGGLYGSGGTGAMNSVYRWARTEDMTKYLNADGTKYRMFEGKQVLADDVENPYWILNKNVLNDKTNRFTGAVNASYKLADWFNIDYRIGYDNYSTNNYTFIAPNGAVKETFQNGKLSDSDYMYEYLSSNLMLNFHKTIADFDLNLLLGQSMEDTKTRTERRNGYNFATEGFYSYENIAAGDKFFQSLASSRRLMGVYGELRAAYKNIAYLTVTSRNDWTSTLPVANRSYFYPSVSGSFVFTELMPKSDILSFGKVRASWARVGKDTDPYATATTLWSPREFLAGVGTGNAWTRGNPYLLPEISESYEFGLELRFFKGRLGVDYTYYNNQSKDQITTPRLSQTTGYILLSTNVGQITNKGMELSITGKPIETKDFSWDMALNVAGNRGRVSGLLTGQNVLYVTDVQIGNAKAASFNNGLFMGISGSEWNRDKDGNVILDVNTGMPTSSGLTTLQIGNREPTLSGGFNNSLQYKNWNLSFLLDFRLGGDIYNGTDYWMTSQGMSLRSQDRESLTINGVVDSGTKDANGAVIYNPKTFTYEAGKMYDIKSGTKIIQQSGEYLIRNYWTSSYANESANYMTNTNILRLRSISLSYNLPERIIKRQNIIKGASATLTGSNLFLLTNYKGMDPETSAAGSGVTGSSSVGMDYCGVPATAGFSVGINLTF